MSKWAIHLLVEDVVDEQMGYPSFGGGRCR